jgi:hypothetical protein
MKGHLRGNVICWVCALILKMARCCRHVMHVPVRATWLASTLWISYRYHTSLLARLCIGVKYAFCSGADERVS